MFKNKLLMISFMIILLIFSVGFVTAQDNNTDLTENILTKDINIDNSMVIDDSNFEIFTNESNNEIDKVDPDFEIEFNDEISPREGYYDGHKVIIKPKVDKLTGNFSVLVDNVKYFYGDENDFGYIELPGFEFKLGNHSLNVAYEGNELYTPFNKTKEFTVKEVAISNLPSEYIVGKSYSYLDLPIDATGSISYYLNDTEKETIKVNPLEDYDYDQHSHFINIDLDDFVMYNQEYNLKVEYNIKYKGQTYKGSKSTVINSVTYPIEISNYQSYEYGLKNEIDFYLPEDIDNNMLKVYIDNNQVKYSSYYSVDISSLKVGKHNLTIVYEGDNKYPCKSISETINIISEIKTPDPLPFNSVANINLTLPNDANGNLSVYIGKAKESLELYKSQSLIDGKVNIEISGFPVGTFYLKAEYDGNYIVNNITLTTIDFTPIIIYPNKITWGQDKYITITADNSSNGIVSLYRYGVLYAESQVINGSGNISLSKFPIGEYYGWDCYIIYETNSYEFNDMFYIKVMRITPKLVGSSKSITMNYADSVSYSLKVWGIYGKVVGKNEIVTFQIGKNSFKVKTDKNGIAKLKISDIVIPGKYTIVASYKGVKVSKKLTVKQILTLKTVKVKKYAKKLVLSAKLSKKLKGKIIIFKFKGKTYKSKINSKGIAKVTIKKSVLKKLKVGKTVTYQATYLKNTVKKSVKVKR